MALYLVPLKFMNKSIMFQGTASSVGKSILATAFCRIFSQDGYKVYPFKSQNMSLNSGITPQGEEIGRAQIMQAQASNQIPKADMNPILLKPTSDRKSQIIVLGKVWGNLDATDYFAQKLKLKPIIENTYKSIYSKADIVVIEGAGSPAEINLDDVFVNMGMAKIAKSPVILIGDIDRGGVFASLYGTVMLLNKDERKMIKGIIINKFRGSIELLKSGLEQIEKFLNIPVIAVIPYFKLDLEDEDSVTDFSKFNKEGDLKVAVIKLPYMSNFTDFNSLALNKNVCIKFVKLNEDLDCYHLIIIPGSKNTIEDLKSLKSSGMYDKIIKYKQDGKYIFGICGGYQMLGNVIIDNIENENHIEAGLKLLNIETKFEHNKTTTISKGIENIFGTSIEGYEIHMGKTKINSKNIFINNSDGCYSKDLKVIGTYFHGIFDNGEFTLKYLNKIREYFKLPIENIAFNYNKYKDEQYNKLADIVRKSVDMNKLYDIIKKGV